MRYNQLADTDLKVSCVGIGAMSLVASDNSQNLAIVQQAYNAGINYFDTADLYDKGLNEQLVGQAVRSFRDKIVLSTKVGNAWRADGSGWDWNPTRSYMMQAVDHSLRRLQTDYIDIYQLHGGTRDDDREEVVRTFEDLIAAGKIRNYGISSIRPNVFTTYAKNSRMVSNMMQYSILDRRPEAYFDLFKDHKVGIIARGSLAQGLLLDKPSKNYLSYTEEVVRQISLKVADAANQYDVSKQAIALAYVLQNPVVVSSVVGVRTVSQLNDLTHALSEQDKLKYFDWQAFGADLPAISYTDHVV